MEDESSKGRVTAEYETALILEDIRRVRDRKPPGTSAGDGNPGGWLKANALSIALGAALGIILTVCAIRFG